MSAFERNPEHTCGTCAWNGKWRHTDGNMMIDCMYGSDVVCKLESGMCSQHPENQRDLRRWMNSDEDEQDLTVAYMQGELAGRDTASAALEMWGKKCKQLEAKLAEVRYELDQGRLGAVRESRYVADCYVAGPYTSDSALVRSMRYSELTKIAAHLFRRGLSVYSPITLTHPMALEGQIDPCDGRLWLDFDKPFQLACRVLVVCHLDGWEQSKGLEIEQHQAMEMGQPVYHLMAFDDDSIALAATAIKGMLREMEAAE